ncbi:MAG: nucleoside hydrolase [Candidatus Hydrogenedentota bacterium]
MTRCLATMLLALLLAAAAPPATAADAVPVILDTDLGDDIDDTWALCMMLGLPGEIDLKLVVTAAHDTPSKTRLVAKMLDTLGRTEIPIGTGVKTADKPINQAKWLGGYSLDQYAGTVHKDGVGALIDCIHETSGPVVLCVIGPQTNIAAALERDPTIAGKTRVVTMAGSVHTGYMGKPERDAEWNVRCDVDAARAVFDAPWEITMAPLDVCGTLRLEDSRYAAVAESKAPLASLVTENYTAWTNRHHHREDASSILFDTVAAYLTFSEELVDVETISLRIDDAGNTVPAAENGRPVRCAMDWKDRPAFEQLLVQALTEPAGPAAAK